MKLLLSVNNYLQDVDPDNFAEFWKSSTNLIDGCEICCIINDKNIDHIQRIAENTVKNDWIFQVHGDDLFDMSNRDILKNLMFYNRLAHVINKRLNVTLHPSQNLNMWFMHKIDDLIHENDLKLLPVFENTATKNCVTMLDDMLYKNLGFCWDIGHHVLVGECEYELPENCRKYLKNIHIHDLNLTTFARLKGEVDHYPFDYGEVDYKKAIQYLKDIGYSGTVVLEIASDYLEDNKAMAFIKQFELIKEAAT